LHQRLLCLILLVFGRSLVAVLHDHAGLAWQSGSPGSTTLLRIIQHAERPIDVDDATDVGHVNAHAHRAEKKTTLSA
jgi:hypothetical protein